MSVQRYLIAALAVERWRVRTKALADALERRADVVTRWCRLGAELRQQDELFRRRYEDLDRALIVDLAADRWEVQKSSALARKKRAVLVGSIRARDGRSGVRRPTEICRTRSLMNCWKSTSAQLERS